MRVNRNILNNMMMNNNRHEQVYQTLITDFALCNLIKVETAEMLLGYEIPDYLTLPNGKTIKDAKAVEASKTKKNSDKSDK